MKHPWLIGMVAAFLVLAVCWIAIKIGRFLLRLAVGVAMLGLIGLIIWYLFLR